MMCASLVGILLTIEHLKHNKIRIDAITGAEAQGITARVDHSPASTDEAAPKKKSAAEAGKTAEPIDKAPASH